MFKKLVVTVLITCFFWTGTAGACSLAHYTKTEYIDGTYYTSYLTGRTMDLLHATEYLGIYANGIIRIIPKGTVLTGDNYVDITQPIWYPVEWTTKYGCITVDDHAAGVNEKGLGIDILYLGGSQYETNRFLDNGISHIKLLSYILTQAASVAEAVDLLDTVNVIEEVIGVPGTDAKWMPGLHWAVRDTSNNMAIIEYVNSGSKVNPKSKRVVYYGQKADVMTNDPPMNKHLAYYNNFARGNRAIGGDVNALDRFVRLKMFKSTLPLLDEYGTAVDDDWTMVCKMFLLMASVYTTPNATDYAKRERGAKQSPNVWTTVMDYKNQIFYLRHWKYPNTIWIDLTRLNFAPVTPMKLDPRSFTLTGDVTLSFVPDTGG